MLPLGIFFISVGLFRNAFSSPPIRNIAIAFGGFWLIAALCYRFVNYQLPLTQAELKKGAKQEAYNTSAIHAADKRIQPDVLYPKVKFETTLGDFTVELNACI